MSDHDNYGAALVEILEGRPSSLHLPGVDYGHHRPASANKHLLCNPAAGLLAMDRHDGAGLDAFFDWLTWYAHEESLDANEETSPSEVYRIDIETGTLVSAGIALATGRDALAVRLCERLAATFAHLGLGAGPAAPRKVTWHGTPGTPLILVGDGPSDPAPGTQGLVPFVAQAGQRGFVREGSDVIPGGTKFDGPFQYTSAWGFQVMLAQALQRPSSRSVFEWQHRTFAAVLTRFPNLPRWGLTAEQIGTLGAFLGNLTDARLAAELFTWGKKCPPGEPRRYVRHVDAAIEAVALRLHVSSTDGVGVVQQLASGVTKRTSATSGSRSKDEISEQTVVADGADWLCRVAATGATMRIPRLTSPEAWCATLGPVCEFTVAGAPTPQPPTPGPTPGPTPPPSPGGSQRVTVRPLTALECQQTGSPLGSCIVSSSSATASVKKIWPGGSGEATRFVVMP